MALRITKKERQFIYQQNRRARQKSERLHELYGKRIQFETRTPSSFTSRTELNRYKEELRVFNAPYTHRYVMGGVTSARTTGNFEQYNLAIPYRMAQEIKRKEKRWNQYVAKNYQNIGLTPYYIRGKEQIQPAITLINPWYPEKQVSYERLKRIGKKHQSYFEANAKLTSFHSIRDVEQYLKKLTYFMNPEYANKRLQQSQINYANAVINTFGENGYPIANLINQLTPQEWGKLYDTEEAINFDYVYIVEQQDQRLQGMANALLQFSFQNDRILSKYDKELREVQAILSLTDVEIKSQYQPHIATFTHEGIRYEVALKHSEIEDFYREGITEEISRRAKRIGNYVPKYPHEKDSETKRSRKLK